MSSSALSRETSRIDLEELQCGICLDIKDKVMESECCHNLLCEDCVKIVNTRNKTCPVCRTSPLKTRPSVIVSRMIANLPVVCDRCRARVTRGTLADHITSAHPKYPCPDRENCGFKTQTEREYLQHLTTAHSEALTQRARLLFVSKKAVGVNTDPVVSDRPSDLIVPAKNRGGNLARLGSSGKYYCGLRKLTCPCCDGRCGPVNGCNCADCMVLDISCRALQPNYLVNSAGCAARQGKTGKFYCGRRVLPESSKDDGYCGPDDGRNCEDCERLDHAKSMYASVWNNSPTLRVATTFDSDDEGAETVVIRSRFANI